MLGFVAGLSNDAKARQALLPVEGQLAALLYGRAQAPSHDWFLVSGWMI